MKFRTLGIIITLLSTFLFPTNVKADEIVLSGNGASSNNDIAVTNNSSNTTSQSNNANINNSVVTEANTGNNQASNNGETIISTGDAHIETTVSNSANQSLVANDCCPQGNSSALIDNNGSGSSNTIAIDQSSNNTVVVNQNAKITTNIYGKANTGRNNANDNHGNVTIRTGNIFVDEKILNGPINVSNVQVSVAGGSQFLINIKDNGKDSENNITLKNKEDTNIVINNNAKVYNTSFWDLNTGKNKALDNVGKIDLKTGDILFTSTIVNGPINVSTVKVDCCEEKKPEKPVKEEKPPVGAPPPSTTTVSSNPSSQSSGGGGQGGSSGSVLSAAVGNILPVTGNNFLLYALMFNLSLFSLGVLVRLYSGRSPNFAYAV